MKKYLHITWIFALMLMMSFAVADFYSSMTKVDYLEASKNLFNIWSNYSIQNNNTK